MKTLSLYSKIFLLIALFATVSACGPVVKANVTPFAQLNTQARTAPAPEYRIQPGDDLEIKFLYNPELNERLPVRPDGRISLQFVKEVLVVGLTPKELGDLLTEKYGPELKKPDVTVIVRSFSAQKVFVDGEVNRGGLLPLTGPLTVLQAIAQAGGVKDTARLTEVLVIRQNPNGPFLTSVVDISKAIDGTDKSQDIALMPYDVVFVPKSPIANVDTWVDLYIRRLLPFSLPSPVPQPYYSY
jgi:protein involved in polysaccharide export with SLBB domain